MPKLNTKVGWLAFTEFALGVLAVQVAAFVRFGWELPTETEGLLLWARAIVFGTAVVVALTAMGLYQLRQRLEIEGVLIRMVLALLLAAAALALIYYVAPALRLWRGWWGLSFIFAAVFLCVSRLAFSRLSDQEVFRRRVVVYGAGKRAGTLLELRRRSDQRGFNLLAFMPVPGETHLVMDPRVDGNAANVEELVRKYDADEVVIAMDDRRRNFPIRELLDCKLSGVQVVDALTFLERESGKVKIDLLDPSWFIFSEGFTQRTKSGSLLRAFDIAVSILVLLVGWPFMLLTALAILLEDGRPVLYRQVRVGLMGKEFKLLKFRSMTKNAEQGGARWAERNDSRVTRVGSLIRKLRLDELPQLFNVLRGDMRLVGPRPERPEFVRGLSERIPYYQERHCVKPGLTGWAQLSYPYGSSEKDALEKLQFDLYYVKNQSLLFDLMILLQTVEVVIWGKGAR